MAKIRTLKRISSHLILIKQKSIYIGCMMLIYVGCLSSAPYFYKVLIDNLEKNLSQNIFSHELIVIIAIWTIFIFGTIIMRYFYGMILLNTVQRDWFNFLIKSTKMMMRLPIDYHIGIQHGEKQKIIDRASEAVWDLGDAVLLHIIPQFLVSIILIISGLMIDIRMTLLSLILLPLCSYGIYKIGDTAYMNQKKASTYWDNLFNRIVDTFSNLKIIRILGREEYEESIIKSRFEKAQDAQYNIRKLWVIFNGTGNFVTTLSQAITLSCGIYFILSGTLSLGTLFFFLAFSERIYGPIFTIFQKIQEMLINIAGYEKMEYLFEMKEEADEGKKILKKIGTNISFKNLAFSYPSSPREILSNIGFTIKKGEKVAFVGHTGSGKSTITQLLMRFYEPSSGSIEIDGTNIYDFTLGSYRSKFAAVFQDTTLFNETIRHNLEYVRDGITEKELEKACKEANILDFIESLPEKWETQVGERGLKLSGGEKQRIAIARAILANPEILILDEATSALDTKTERLVQDAFEHLMHGRTSIIIAHRLSTIQSVDTIYFMEKGKIIASGNHRELYEKSKEYRELVDLQHDGFIGEDEEKENI